MDEVERESEGVVLPLHALLRGFPHLPGELLLADPVLHLLQFGDLRVSLRLLLAYLALQSSFKLLIFAVVDAELFKLFDILL